MSRVKDLPIYRAGYDLAHLVASQVKNFSRDFRPTLGRMLQEESVALVLCIYRANAAHDKTHHIGRLLERLEVVEMLMQLSFDMKLIPPSAFARSIEITSGLGRQAGGWKKHSEKCSITA